MQAKAYKMKVGRKDKSSDNNDADGVPVVDDIVKPVSQAPREEVRACLCSVVILTKLAC